MVSALVGAGGNLGAVIAGFCFYKPIQDALLPFQVHAGYVSLLDYTPCFFKSLVEADSEHTLLGVRSESDKSLKNKRKKRKRKKQDVAGVTERRNEQEPIGPEEALSPKDRLTRRHFARWCIPRFSWFGCVLVAVLPVSVSGEGLSSSSSCRLDALNFCPWGCTVERNGSQVSFGNACAEHGYGNGFHLSDWRCLSANFTEVFVTEPHLQMLGCAVGLPTTVPNFCHVPVSDVGLPTCDFCPLRMGGSLMLPVWAHGPVHSFNVSEYEFSFAFEVFARLSQWEWGPRFGKCYLAVAFLISASVVFHGMFDAVRRVWKRHKRKIRNRFKSGTLAASQDVVRSLRRKICLSKRKRVQYRRKKPPAPPRQTPDGTWIQSARKYGIGGGHQVRCKPPRVRTRIRAQVFRLSRRYPDRSVHVIRKVCVHSRCHRCLWFLPHAAVFDHTGGLWPPAYASGASASDQTAATTTPQTQEALRSLEASLLGSGPKTHWHGGGGGAGAAASKRQRQEQKLLLGLQALLASLSEDEDPAEVGPQSSPQPRGRSPTPREVSSGPRDRTSRSPSPGWQVKGKGKKGLLGKGGKGKGTGGSPNDGTDPPRRVSFEPPNARQPSPACSSEASLLAQLKALVLQCETKGSHGLLGSLKALVQSPTPAPQVQPQSRAPAVAWASPSGNKGKGKSERSAQAPQSWAVDSKWWPGKLCSASTLEKHLEDGEEPGDDVAAVVTLEQAKASRGLAVAHELKSKVALILKDHQGSNGPEGLKASKSWIRLVDGKWKEAWVTALSEELPSWGHEPAVVECKSVPEKVKQATLKVTIPKAFQSSYDWDETVRKPASAVRVILPDDLAVRSYGWHKTEHEISGFLKLPEASSLLVLGNSGSKGVFVKRVDNQTDSGKRALVKWLPIDKMKAPAYYAMAKREADKAKVPLAYRAGGRSCLGLIGVSPGENDSEASIKRRWAAKGVPSTWFPAQLQQLLASQHWRVISDIQAPARPKGVWTFSAAPPQAHPTSQWFLKCGEQGTIEISPWHRSTTTRLTSQPMRAHAAWVSRVKSPPKRAETAKAAEKPEQNSQDQVPPTLIDGSLPDDAVEVVMGDRHGESHDDKRGEKHDRTGVPSPNKPPKAQRVDPSTSPLVSGSAGPDGAKLWDLGGFGDCGFRCLAGSNALRLGATVEKLEPKIAKVALSLRTKAADWLEGNQAAWVLEWYPDADCTVDTEGGFIPQDASQYLSACRRPSKWLDPWMTLAAAHVLQVEVLVFKHVQKKWKFLERVVPRNKTSCKPLFLFLKDQHFYTLHPEASPPAKWDKLGLDDTRPAASQSYLGGGRKSSRGSASSAGSESSLWLRPVVDARSSASSKVPKHPPAVLPQDLQIEGSNLEFRSGKSETFPTTAKEARSSDAILLENAASETSLWLRPAPSHDGRSEGLRRIVGKRTPDFDLRKKAKQAEVASGAVPSEAVAGAGLKTTNQCQCGWRVPAARYPEDPMPGVQRRKHWGKCIHCMEPYVRRPAALANNQVPLRNQVATQVLARKLSLFRAAGLSWAHDIEVKEVRPSSWPGRSAVKGSRKGLGGVSRWCRCTKCDHENSASELMRNICPQSKAGLGDAPKPSKKVRSQAASAFHKKACREQCALGGSKATARKLAKVLKKPAACQKRLCKL